MDIIQLFGILRITMENNKETRVTLQYGITIDELPEEIEHLSRKISKRQWILK